MKLIVYHTSYGCDTGCCGHTLEDESGKSLGWTFFEPHPSEDFKKWAESFVEESGCNPKDLDWDNCKIVSC